MICLFILLPLKTIFNRNSDLTMNTLLRCHNLDIAVAKTATLLVQQLHWVIQPGQCWVVLGPNGAGKSSLLRVLSGLQPSDFNTLYWRAQPLQTYTIRQRAQHIGLLVQQGNTGLQNTALELVLSGLYPHHASRYWENTADQQTAQQALADVGLANKAHTPLSALSGGELRRAEIARLLVHNPCLALLDEPLNHLDIGQQLSMLHLLQQRFQNTAQALVLVLHDLNLARQVATHGLLLFGDGRWQAGPIESIAQVSHLSALMRHPLTEFDTPYGKQLGVEYTTR